MTECQHSIITLDTERGWLCNGCEVPFTPLHDAEAAIAGTVNAASSIVVQTIMELEDRRPQVVVSQTINNETCKHDWRPDINDTFVCYKCDEVREFAEGVDDPEEHEHKWLGPECEICGTSRFL